MRDIADHWRGRPGPHGNGFDAAAMVATADRAAFELATGIIGKGCAT
jgi:hypothetical protein